MLRLALLLAGIGGAAGTLTVYMAPRLVAYRLSELEPRPGAAVLLPLVGGWPAGWRPVRTLAYELLVASVCFALAVHYGNNIRLPLAAAYSVLLLGIAYIDLEHRLVLNRLSYPGILLALAASWLWPGLGPVNALVGALISLLLFGVLELVGRGALGTGDTKLAILIGAMRGFPGAFNALLLGVVLGGVAAAFILFVLRRGRKDYMAYAPYLSAGAVLSFFFTAP